MNMGGVNRKAAKNFSGTIYSTKWYTANNQNGQRHKARLLPETKLDQYAKS